MSIRTSCLLDSLPASIRPVPVLALLAAAAALGLAAPSAFAAPAPAQAGCLDTQLAPLADSGVAGSARLCIGDDGVRAQVATSNLAADKAYTASRVVSTRRSFAGWSQLKRFVHWPTLAISRSETRRA